LFENSAVYGLLRAKHRNREPKASATSNPGISPVFQNKTGGINIKHSHACSVSVLIPKYSNFTFTFDLTGGHLSPVTCAD